MTTWRLESMWTRTLSTSISTSPSSMAGLSHGRRCRRGRRGRRPVPTRAGREHQPCDQGTHDEPADVRKDRHATRLDDPDRGETIDELEHEPEAEDEDGRHVDELVEETEEDERRDARAWEEHEVGAERRGDGAGRADGRHRRRRVDRDLGQSGERAAEEVEREEANPSEAVLDVVPEDPQVEHVAEQVEPAAMEELAGDERRRRLRQEVTVGPCRRPRGRNDAPMADEVLDRRLAAAREQAELPGEDDETGDDQRQRDERRLPRRGDIPPRDYDV